MKMTNLIFAIYDKKAEAYLKPFMLKTKGEALRSFMDAVNDEKTMFFKHADDYALYELGSYDDTTGTYLQETEDRMLSDKVKETVKVAKLVKIAEAKDLLKPTE
jgi:hypothetical protein